MQQTQQTLVASVNVAPAVPTKPVELPLDQLGRIAGGTPKGTW